MSNQEQASFSSTILMEETTSQHHEVVKSSGIAKPKGTLLTTENDDIVRFNGYYALNITTGNHKGAEGAFFTIDTNMHVTTVGTVSTAEYYLQFILSMNGTSSVAIPFTGTFTNVSPGVYKLQQTANGVGGMNEVTFDLTFSRSEVDVTVTVDGKITVAAPDQGQSSVTGSTYNNPILPTTYIGTYYDVTQVKTLEIGQDHKLSYRADDEAILLPIDTYNFDLNMYVFSFLSLAESNAKISLVMGTSPNSGLVCGDFKTIDHSQKAPTQRSLNTIKAPIKVPKLIAKDINLSSNDLAPFSAYYPTPTDEFPAAFIAIQATTIDAIFYEVMIGVSTDGIHSTVYNFDKTMSFDELTNTLKIPNPEYVTNLNAPEFITNIKFKREYIKGHKSGQLIKLEGKIMGEAVTSYTPFNLIPLSGFMGAVLTNNTGETLVVNSNIMVTYKGKAVSVLQNILYVPIMYILEFTNPHPPESESTDLKHKVVCSFGTDSKQGLACIVTECTLRGNTLIHQEISYYHSVPK